MTTEELSSTHRADYQTPDFNKLKSNNDLQNSSQSLSNSGSDSQRALVWWIKNTIGTSEILLTRTKNSIRLLTLSFCHVVWLFKALGKFKHSVNQSKSLWSHFKRQRRARFPLIHCRTISRNYPGKIGENHVMATDKKLQALAPSSMWLHCGLWTVRCFDFPISDGPFKIYICCLAPLIISEYTVYFHHFLCQQQRRFVY